MNDSVNDSSHNQASFDEEQEALINQVRAETQAEWEEAPIQVLHLSPATRAFLHRAGFRTIHHVLHPTSVVLFEMMDNSHLLVLGQYQ